MAGALLFKIFVALALVDNWADALVYKVFWAVVSYDNWAGALACKVCQVTVSPKGDNVEGMLRAGDFGDASVDDGVVEMCQLIG